MKLTKKIWSWLSQLIALPFLIALADLIMSFLDDLPAIDVSALRPLIKLFGAVAAFWGAWLIWRAYDGFYRKMDFLTDATDGRW